MLQLVETSSLPVPSLLTLPLVLFLPPFSSLFSLFTQGGDFSTDLGLSVITILAWLLRHSWWRVAGAPSFSVGSEVLEKETFLAPSPSGERTGEL